MKKMQRLRHGFDLDDWDGEYWLNNVPTGINDVTVELAPEVPGVFGLLKDDTLVFVGFALSSIRRKLRQHFRGEEGICTKTATHFVLDACDSPEVIHAELLAFYKAADGHLPTCNKG